MVWRNPLAICERHSGIPGCGDARYMEFQERRQARGLYRSHARYQPRPRHSSTSLSPAWQERQVRELIDDLTGKFLDSHPPRLILSRGVECAPYVRKGSLGGLDRMPGMLILELYRAQISERGVETS